MKKLKVLVAMSGGVDSSVAALMMKRKGFEVIGVFMKNYSDSKNEITGNCIWKDERKMAIKIASKLGIPLITLDSEEEYKKKVIEKMFRNYKRGFTPNPDIDCNQKIKFPVLIKTAKTLGCNFVVTGHYARIKKIAVENNKNIRFTSFRSQIKDVNNKTSEYSYSGSVANNSSLGGWAGQIFNTSKKFQYSLLRAKDESKDQSYFLYRLKQNQIKHLLFPIGEYTKKQVREIAEKNKFPNHDKKSTVGICFVGKVNLKEFLKKKIKPRKGKILNPEGKIIGFHDGIYYYTIGQRLGLRYGFDLKKLGDDKRFIKRWYVAKKQAGKNVIIAAPEGHPLLFRKEIFLKNPHWINEDEIRDFFKNNDGTKLKCEKGDINLKFSQGGMGGNKEKKQNEKSIKLHARIRQVGELLPCMLVSEKNKFKVTLNKAITGVSEGQAIVLYKGKVVLGGGEIRFR